MKANAEITEDTNNHWDWGCWELCFSEDHTKVEVVPYRDAQYHYCVTKLLEEFPCSNCLSIGKPAVQPDGTVKLKVTLKHPFPTIPKYTGFDVRGMVYFPPTSVYLTGPYLDYLCYLSFPIHEVLPSPYSNNLPLVFSRADQGGGELLNPDGYSCYMIPGAIYSKDWPIYSYSPPKYSNEPTPFSTINPYKLFASDLERRMFLVTDEITREYHFALPPGAFNFGYAVDASWWPPTTTPVTNPAADFPRAANAEDPWLVEYEQLLPICAENVGKDIFKVTVHHRGVIPDGWYGFIWVWDLSTDCPPYGGDPEFYIDDNEEFVDDYTVVGYFHLYPNWWSNCGGGIIPGHHFAVLVVKQPQDSYPDPKAELTNIIGARFIDIYVKE